MKHIVYRYKISPCPVRIGAFFLGEKLNNSLHKMIGLGINWICILFCLRSINVSTIRILHPNEMFFAFFLYILYNFISLSILKKQIFVA